MMSMVVTYFVFALPIGCPWWDMGLICVSSWELSYILLHYRKIVGYKRIGYNIMRSNMDVMLQSACLVFNTRRFNNLLPSLIAGWWDRPQTQRLSRYLAHHFPKWSMDFVKLDKKWCNGLLWNKGYNPENKNGIASKPWYQINVVAALCSWPCSLIFLK